jgi:hypothetical protein
LLLADGLRVDGEFDLLQSLFRVGFLFFPLLLDIALYLLELTMEVENIGLGAF